MSLITINYSDFVDILTHSELNPLANKDFIEMAIKKQVVIFDVDNHYHYIIDGLSASPDNCREILKYKKRVLIGYTGIAQYLQIPDTVVLKYISLMKINPIIVLNDLSGDGIYLFDQFESKLKELVMKFGIDETEAQLKLGVTSESFQKIKGNIKYETSGKFLSDLVDSFFRSYLPKHTVFTTRKAAIECFVKNYNQQNGSDIIIQFCEDCTSSDKHPASDTCSQCKKYLCPRHAHWLPDQKVSIFSPLKVCQNCLDNLGDNK